MELLSECDGNNSVIIRDNSDKIKNIVVGNNVSYSSIGKSSAGIHSRNARPTALMSPVPCRHAGFPYAVHPNTVFLHAVWLHDAHFHVIHIHIPSVSTTWIL